MHLNARPHCDLGLAVADIPADQPVHRLGQLHVLFDLPGDADLVLGGLVGERLLELPLPLGVSWVGDPRLGLSQRLHPQHLLGQFLDRLDDLFLGLLPSRAAQVRQVRLEPAGPHVLLHQVDLAGWHVQRRVAREFQGQVFFGPVVLLECLEALELGDTVLHVHHVIAGR